MYWHLQGWIFLLIVFWKFEENPFQLFLNKGLCITDANKNLVNPVTFSYLTWYQIQWKSCGPRCLPFALEAKAFQCPLQQK